MIGATRPTPPAAADLPTMDAAAFESWDRRFAPTYPVKRRPKEDLTLTPGIPVAHRGFAATLVEYVPSPLTPKDPCSICLEALGSTYTSGADILTQPCGHAFHKSCLEQWRYRTPGRFATCPLCRTIFSDSDVTYPYNKWTIAYENGTSATVRASTVKRERPPPEPFNPRHKDDFFRRAKSGEYLEPLPKRTSRPTRHPSPLNTEP